MSELYGSAFVKGYGSVMPDTWSRYMDSLTLDQIKQGLEALPTLEGTFPPNAITFAKLCRGSDTHRGGAYISFDDPRHSDYKKPLGVESDSAKKKKLKVGNSALAGLKDLF